MKGGTGRAEAAFSLLLLLGLAAGLLVVGLWGLSRAGGRLLAPFWQPPGALGLLPLLLTSLLVSAAALLLTVAVALPGAVAFRVFLPPPVRLLLARLVRLLLAVPSVVWAFWGLDLVLPLLRRSAFGGFGLPLAVLGLFALLYPLLFSLFCQDLLGVEEALLEQGLALGASPWQAGWGLLVRSGAVRLREDGLVAGLRALGEGMVVAALIGNAAGLSWPPLGPSSTLTSVLVLDAGAAPPGSAWEGALFADGLLLFLLAVLGEGVGRWRAGRGGR